MSVTNIRVRTTSARREPGLARAAASMISRIGAGLAGGVVRDGASGRPGPRPSCPRPSTSRRRRSPGCSRRRPPTARPTRSAGARSCPRGRSSRQARTSGSAAIAEQQAGQQRRPRHDRVDVQVLGRRVVVAADRARGRRGSATPIPAVVFASDAPPVEASSTSKPSARATRLGVLDQPAAALELLHRPPAGHRLERRRSRPGPRSPRRSRGSRPRPPRGPRGRSPGRRPRACTVSATTFGRVPPAMTPDVDGHARPAAVERVQLADDPRRLEDRAAALLGLDAGVRRAAVDVIRRSRMPLRAETMSPLARAHSRTSATSASAAIAADVRRRASASRSPRPGWR